MVGRTNTGTRARAHFGTDLGRNRDRAATEGDGRQMGSWMDVRLGARKATHIYIYINLESARRRRAVLRAQALSLCGKMQMQRSPLLLLLFTAVSARPAARVFQRKLASISIIAMRAEL